MGAGPRSVLGANRSPSIRLADLLIEVENDLGFSVHFQQPGEKRVDPRDVCALLAAIALAAIVHGISRLDAAGHWGDGTTARGDEAAPGFRAGRGAGESGFPVDPAAAIEQLRARLSDAFDRFLEGVADNRQVAFDDDGWRLKTDAARLADLLIEVENDLGFSVHFQQPGERVDPGEVCALLAAILAHGCNLGLYTMEKVAPDIAYRRLKNVSDWRLVEENQRAALAAIVHGISRLDAAGHWGDGTTSASDGQRFAMPQKVLQRTYSTRFNDFALEFYSFVADNYAPFYSRPIECTDRDAPFVLDGVLYHESDLDLEEHYTDTHGYTEINFAAFGMVGMRFCPRIRSLHRQRIYCADPDRDHGVIEEAPDLVLLAVEP